MAPSEVCPPTDKLEIRGMLTSHKVLTPAAEASVGQTPLRRSPTARVLIIDDEPAACKLLALLLSEADFECKTALGGAEALRLLEKDNRDAIVCDLNMPGMTGMELLAEVRRRSPQVAFLVATGLDDVRAGILAMKSGADDYLVTPLPKATPGAFAALRCKWPRPWASPKLSTKRLPWAHTLMTLGSSLSPTAYSSNQVPSPRKSACSCSSTRKRDLIWSSKSPFSRTPRS